MNKSKTVSEFIAVALGIVFITASWPKLHFPYEFLSGVYSYELVRPAPGLYLSILLPWLELVVGICLVANVLTEGALAISAFLCLVFSVGQILVFSQGLSISCNCFGGGGAAIGYWSIGRTVGLFLLSLAAYWLAFRGDARKGAPRGDAGAPS
ncbi:MAG: hypothetical protein JXR94_16045 [Candidatus Hydrogenedentes bacterium]|nr:hypothetical protein [Candidatus Hydrogenedentota bacterium]